MENNASILKKLKSFFFGNQLFAPPPEKKKTFWEEYGYLGLCMVLPALVMYLMYVARGIHPIADGSVLVLDLNGQYVWFFEALRNFVKGDASLLYSFSRAMGGEFMGIYAYYLASPLSFLLCLFPTNRMLEGLLVLFLLKTAICGGTFGYYMHKTSTKRRPTAVIVLLGCCALANLIRYFGNPRNGIFRGTLSEFNVVRLGKLRPYGNTVLFGFGINKQFAVHIAFRHFFHYDLLGFAGFCSYTHFYAFCVRDVLSALAVIYGRSLARTVNGYTVAKINIYIEIHT
jgi:hypothetical protein